MSDDDIAVMIVGAGPTGLSLAAELHRLGQKALLIDAAAEGAKTSRAAAIHARTLEVLESLGATPALLSEGLIADRFRLRERDDILLDLSFDTIPSRYPFILMCPQDRTEAVLLDRLRAYGGEATRRCRLVSLDITGNRATATLETGGATRTVTARWVVGCDGMHSTVREAAGIAFDGGRYASNFVLADVRMDWPFPRDEADAIFSSVGFLAAFPLPHDRFRLIATVPDAPEHPTQAFMQALLDARGPRARPARILDTGWTSRFRVHHRVARTLRSGPVLLCGDAAHVHSPAGGQGMNTGIQDAISLAAPLMRALDTGNTAEIDAWASARRKRAERVVRMTDRMMRLVDAPGGATRIARNAALRLVNLVPGITGRIATRIAELDEPAAF